MKAAEAITAGLAACPITITVERHLAAAVLDIAPIQE
jgi:hypothetical protein